MKTIILLLFITAKLSAQQPFCKRFIIEFEFAPIENYVTGGMLIGTYFVIDYADHYYYEMYGNTLLRTQARNKVFFGYMATTIITHVAIKQVRKLLKR